MDICKKTKDLGRKIDILHLILSKALRQDEELQFIHSNFRKLINLEYLFLIIENH